uniref:SAP domain-containing protein n=1 Tax=Magallana gigas TaxID=29159 RepID=A0A8W8LYM3_MAGGI
MTASWKHYPSLQKTTLARPIKKGLDAAKRSKIESAPYDLNRPENWTVEKLREELRKNNVTFRQSNKKSVLLKKVKDLTLSRSRVEHVEDRPVVSLGLE